MKDSVQTAQELSAGLEQALGQQLRSVLLYGSVARGEAIPGVSDINVLVVLERITTAELRAAAPLARRWSRAGNTAPLLLAWSEWRRAADAFAIELADMIEAHRMLYGADPLEGLEVQRRALRLQAERELRGKIIQLREGLMVAAAKPSEIGSLLLRALPSFMTYMRAALRLAGRVVPARDESVLRQGCELLGCDDAPLQRAREARGRRRPPAWSLDEPVVGGYFQAMERLADHIDASPEETGS
ncbi:MAG: nucleotidyltransferase domain-containing protein [Longimicrobiales bacterium]